MDAKIMEGRSGNRSSLRKSEMLKEKLEPFTITGFLDKGQQHSQPFFHCYNLGSYLIFQTNMQSSLSFSSSIIVLTHTSKYALTVGINPPDEGETDDKVSFDDRKP